MSHWTAYFPLAPHRTDVATPGPTPNPLFHFPTSVAFIFHNPYLYLTFSPVTYLVLGGTWWTTGLTERSSGAGPRLGVVGPNPTADFCTVY
jgi:hypothetical protein